MVLDFNYSEAGQTFPRLLAAYIDGNQKASIIRSQSDLETILRVLEESFQISVALGRSNVIIRYDRSPNSESRVN